MAKTRPNEPCPCGSGAKYKKCCATGRPLAVRFTRDDRERAYAKLAILADQLLSPEERADLEAQMWGDVPVAEDDDSVAAEMTALAFDCWCNFDVELEDGTSIADVAVAQAGFLTPAERAYVEVARASRMRLHEVTAVTPGQSLTLRDVLDGSVRQVRERSASRSLHRWDLIAGRVFSVGASGQPELDGGLFPIPRGRKDELITELRADLEAAPPGASPREAQGRFVPLFHQAWRRPAAMPRLVNYDGDELVDTQVHFDLADPSAAIAALDAMPELTRETPGAERWTWAGVGTDRKDPILRGFVVVERVSEREGDSGVQLVLRTNSQARAQAGRVLLEGALGPLVHHHATATSDVREDVVRALARGDAPEEPAPSSELREPMAAAEAMLQDHYQRWIDEPVPMFDGKTPREAAASGALRSRVAEALKDLERMYEGALASGAPAFDPSWLRDELHVHEEGEAERTHPPPLAHETVAALAPELAEVAVQLAERVRLASKGSLERTIRPTDLAADLAVQHLIRDSTRESAHDADVETASSAAAVIETYVALHADFELHRRKVFWVAPPLSWALGTTRLDLRGDALRLPFASFAIVFVDRYALALAERVISREPGARLRGRMLRALTVYVTRLETEAADGVSCRITFGCDALDDGWPYVIARDLHVAPATDLGAALQSRWPGIAEDDLDPISQSFALRDLLSLTVNAILYATSADAPRDVRAPSACERATPRSRGAKAFSSESVFYLPGTIDISAVRAIQLARRGSSDRAQVHRCLVRGHWRRPNPSWKDDRPRWVEPYWRGPKLAAIVERPYRLEP